MDRSEWVRVPKEVRDLYQFMVAAFSPFTSQQEQIAISLKKAKDAMLAAAPPPPAEQASGEIQRWRATGDYAFPAEEADDGEFVAYDDHVAAIAALSQRPVVEGIDWRWQFVHTSAMRYMDGGLAKKAAERAAEQDALLIEATSDKPAQVPGPDGGEAVATVHGYDSWSRVSVEWHRKDMKPGTKLYTHPTPAPDAVARLVEAGQKAYGRFMAINADEDGDSYLNESADGMDELREALAPFTAAQQEADQ